MNSSPGNWIRTAPLLTFFGSAAFICFATMFPAIYLVPKDSLLGQLGSYYLGMLGAFSPAIAAIAVTRLREESSKRSPWARRIRVFLPVWIVAIAVNVANLRTTAPPSASLIGLLILSMPVALLPAWIISSAANGAPGVRHMLQSILKPRGKLIYYAVALFTFPVVHIAGSLATNAFQGSASLSRMHLDFSLLQACATTFFAVFFFSGGLNEESGWRGFAQKHLQVTHSPIVAALILWLYMVIWHIPNDLLQYQQGGYLAVRWGLYPFITILFTWVFNRTNGSILAVALFHSSMNSMNPLMHVFPNTTIGNMLLIGFAASVAIFDRMWVMLPRSHPAVQLGSDSNVSNESAG